MKHTHMRRALSLLDFSDLSFGARSAKSKKKQIYSISNRNFKNGTWDIMDFQIVKTVKNPEEGVQVRVIAYTSYKEDGSRNKSSKYNGTIFELYLAQKGAGHDNDMVYVDGTTGNLIKPYHTTWELLPQRITLKSLCKKCSKK